MVSSHVAKLETTLAAFRTVLDGKPRHMCRSCCRKGGVQQLTPHTTKRWCWPGVPSSEKRHVVSRTAATWSIGQTPRGGSNSCHVVGRTSARPVAFERRPEPFFIPGGKGVRRKVGVCKAVSGGEASPKVETDFFVENESAVRSLPLVAGGVGGLLVVINRAVSGIAAVADASSAQSRADVLALVLAATLLLTGLIWRSIQSRPTVSVGLGGVPCLRVEPSLPQAAKDELLWAWDLLQSATRCRALVVVYRKKVVLQAGPMRRSDGSDEPAQIDVLELERGKISSAVLRSGQANYFANLVLFPGRFEFLEFLPANTQGLIVQPLGDEGLLLAATDTVRGFVPKDQAWIATLAEKLDTTLQSWQERDGTSVEEGRSEQTVSSL